MNNLDATPEPTAAKNPLKKHRRGDVREDGRVYWHNVHGVEYWVEPQKFAEMQAKAKQRRIDNIEKCRESTRKSYYKYCAKRKEARAKYRKENHRKILDYFINRRKRDPKYALICSLRSRLYQAFTKRKVVRERGLGKILGAPLDQAKAHLEKQFTEGMSWENYGDWHVDHIIPLSSAKTQEDLVVLCHHTNLQPLWAEENLRKGAKIKDA